MAVPNLTREAARQRADLLSVQSYDVGLDLTDGAGMPSERTFRSRTTIRFSAARPGESTFIDLIAAAIHSVQLNGAPVDTSNYRPEDGLTLLDLQPENVLVVDADMQYTNTGEGLHRFVDPVDGESYLYSQFETADAKRVYACFDQPDLKATFTFRVTVPPSWESISNARVESVEDDATGKVVHFRPTARMSTYVTAVVAGPYAKFTDSHDGIDLGLYCRRSLAEFMDPDEFFAVTKQGFDWYHANFGMRYPFDHKYDQLIVPEFNAGAMENAACVTFREDYIFRSKVTDSRRERRGETILHEMAHMWFGDLVTMRWWDDLWLNESFATYAALLSQSSATRWQNAWTTFANVQKTWAYRQDQLPSTHPIATDAPDVQTAEVNFDGITYAKGASVLKQLASYVGVDAFLAGLRQYFADHAYGNTTLADLLTALERSSGRELGSWSKLWLETAGLNTIRPEFTLTSDGRYASFELVQSAPTEVAASNVLRPHRLAVGLYRLQGDRLVRTERVELDVTGERTPVEQLIGGTQADVLLANDDDLTYCKLRLDERSLKTLREGGIARFDSSLPRAIAWSAAWDMTRDGELATRHYMALVLSGAEHESDVGVLQSLTRQALRALEIYADPQWAPTGYRQLADTAFAAMQRAEPGSDQQLAWVHALVGAARSQEHVDVLEGLLDATFTVPGLSVDTDLRWALLQALAARGRAGEDRIAAELERDPSAAGQRHALICRTLHPSPQVKEDAWRRAIEDVGLPSYVLEAVVIGFASPLQAELIRPYAARYFQDVDKTWSLRTSEIAQGVVQGLFPIWSSTITPETLAMADEFLAKPDVPPALRRLVSEGRADVARALHARKTDAAAL